MGLEAFTGIWTLNSAWPVGASDLKSQGDDHIRGVKAALLATFANITGPVTVSHTVLNGVQNAANLTSGSIPDARVPASAVTQHEASIGTTAATVERVARRDASGHIFAVNFNSSAALDSSGPYSEIAYRNGSDNYFRSGPAQGVDRALTLANWTIQSDPGGTPTGSPGQVFAYY